MNLIELQSWGFAKRMAFLAALFIVSLVVVNLGAYLYLSVDSEVNNEYKFIQEESARLAGNLIESGKPTAEEISIVASDLTKNISSRFKTFFLLLTFSTQVLTFGLLVIAYRFLFIPKKRKYYLWKESSLVLFVLTPLLFYYCMGLFPSIVGLNEYVGLEYMAKYFDGQLSDMILSYSVFNPTNKTELLIQLFFVAMVPAVFEELFFRGTLQQALLDFFGNFHNAIFFTALIFALFHFQWAAFLWQFTLGVILGYAYYWGRSILIPMLFHFCNNGISVFGMYYANVMDPEAIETAKNNADDSPAALFISVLFLGGALLIFFLDHRKWVISKFIIKD